MAFATRRIPLACTACKRRKTRCDGLPTCAQCSRLRTQCVYEDAAQRSRRLRFVNVNPAPAAASIPANTSATESLSPGSAKTIVVPEEYFTSIENRLNHLTALVSNLQQQRERVTLPSDESSHSYNEAVPEWNPPSDGGKLAVQPSGRVRYVEPTYWALLCDDVSEIDNLLSRQNRYVMHISPEEPEAESSNPIPDWSTGLATPPVGSNRTSTPSVLQREQDLPRRKNDAGDIFPSFCSVPTRSAVSHFRRCLPQIISQLPAKGVCDFLIKVYFTGYHPLVPLFPSAEFLRRYEVLWSQVDHVQDVEPNVITFFPLLLAVLFAGAAICPLKDFDAVQRLTADGNIANILYSLSTKVLRFSSFPDTPTLESLTAYLICQTTLAREEEPLTCCAWSGLALRVAQVLGLHRDPGHFHLSTSLAETRRRVWWHLLHIDNDVSIASGTPLMIDTALSDVLMINELDENMTDVPILLSSRNLSLDSRVGFDEEIPMDKQGVTPHGIYLGGKMAEVQASREILTVILQRKTTSGNMAKTLVDIIKNFEKNINERMERLKAWDVRGTPNQEDMFSLLDLALGNQQLFIDWALLLMPALVGRCWSIAQRVIPSHQVELQEKAREECRRCLARLVLICGRDDLRYFQWLWPVVHQPLHAIMVLIADVGNNTNRAHTAASRALVEAVFAFYEPTKGMVGSCINHSAGNRLSESGQETWEYIIRHRRMTWTRCMLDPDERWSRDEAIAFSQDYLSKPLTSGNAVFADVNMNIEVPASSNLGGTGHDLFPLSSEAQLGSPSWNFPLHFDPFDNSNEFH